MSEPGTGADDRKSQRWTCAGHNLEIVILVQSPARGVTRKPILTKNLSCRLATLNKQRGQSVAIHA